MPTAALRHENLHDRTLFEPLEVLDHAALVPATNRWLRRPSLVLFLYGAANGAALAGVAWAVARSGTPVLEALSRVCLGVVLGYAALVPVHENVHALAYRSVGARNVAVTYKWRTLTAFCAANRFVTGGWSFAWVCAAPFFLLNPLLMVLVLTVPPAWKPVMAGALLLHVGACSGDVGMLNYQWTLRPAPLVTYDDLDEGKTYFFRPVRS